MKANAFPPNGIQRRSIGTATTMPGNSSSAAGLGDAAFRWNCLVPESNLHQVNRKRFPGAEGRPARTPL